MLRMRLPYLSVRFIWCSKSSGKENFNTSEDTSKYVAIGQMFHDVIIIEGANECVGCDAV